MRKHSYAGIGGLLVALAVTVLTAADAQAQPRGFGMRQPGFGAGAGFGFHAQPGFSGPSSFNVQGFNAQRGFNPAFGANASGFSRNQNASMFLMNPTHFPSANFMLARPSGTATITLSHPTAQSSLVTRTTANGTTTTRFTQPTPASTSVTTNSNLSFQNSLSAFRAFSSDLREFPIVVNGTTTVTRPNSTSERITTTLPSGGLAVTTISHPNPLTATVTSLRPWGTGTTTLNLSSSGDRVRTNATITFSDSLQGFRTLNPANFGGSVSGGGSVTSDGP